MIKTSLYTPFSFLGGKIVTFEVFSLCGGQGDSEKSLFIDIF